MSWLVVLAIAFWLAAWAVNEWLSRRTFADHSVQKTVNLLIPLLFGVAVLVLWEGITRGLAVPPVLLPPPSMIWERIMNSLPILWADFQQTFLKAVLAGYVLGCGSGFLVALLCDRSSFLKRGLLPLGNFVSALPIIGVAPIMVMWFGFDWQSKAAVVV
ncbi:MAG: ABC transporter permease, partial [Pseudomonadota bacterium]